jgi:hypothetical protein
MSGVSFLLIVVVISVVGSIIVWLRNRQPNDPLSSVSDFQREMDALGTTSPVVPAGGFEAKPVRRVNTVHVRPNIAPPDVETGANDGGDANADSDSPSDSEYESDIESEIESENESGTDNERGR